LFDTLAVFCTTDGQTDTVFLCYCNYCNKKMRWHDQLQEWKSGNVPTNPSSLSIPTHHGANTGRYFFETSPIDSRGDNEYHETLIWSPALDRMSYDPTPFRDYLIPAEQKDPYISIVSTKIDLPCCAYLYPNVGNSLRQ
jgi:hypothetical protein